MRVRGICTFSMLAAAVIPAGHDCDWTIPPPSPSSNGCTGTDGPLPCRSTAALNESCLNDSCDAASAAAKSTSEFVRLGLRRSNASAAVRSVGWLLLPKSKHPSQGMAAAPEGLRE
jgi:hypothetical protein